jgi:hypothetical protein
MYIQKNLTYIQKKFYDNIVNYYCIRTYANRLCFENIYIDK